LHPAFERSPSPHQADDTGVCKRRRPATHLLLGRCRGERTGVAHVVQRGLDPAVGALDVGDAERVDMAVAGIGDAGDMPPDAEEIRVEICMVNSPRSSLRRSWFAPVEE
jgi:hypothetical protein